MIGPQLGRPFPRTLDSRCHPRDALLFLFKLIYSVLSNFKLQLKIERSRTGRPLAQGHSLLGAVTLGTGLWAPSPPGEPEPHPEAELGPNGGFEKDNSLGNQLKGPDKDFRRYPSANYSPGPHI